MTAEARKTHPDQERCEDEILGRYTCVFSICEGPVSPVRSGLRQEARYGFVVGPPLLTRPHSNLRSTSGETVPNFGSRRSNRRLLSRVKLPSIYTCNFRLRASKSTKIKKATASAAGTIRVSCKHTTSGSSLHEPNVGEEQNGLVGEHDTGEDHFQLYTPSIPLEKLEQAHCIGLSPESNLSETSVQYDSGRMRI